MPDVTFEWSPDHGGLLPAREELPNPLVIDSWRVAEGHAVALAEHEHRFSRACLRTFPRTDPEQLEGFLAAARRVVPRTGSAWPRLQAAPGARDMPGLSLRLRDAPRPARTASLWTAPYVARKYPRVKGPDLELLGRLRARAREHGATDAVLVDERGVVLETDHSALVWWRGDRLCCPSERLPRLASVTQRQVLREAAARGIGIAFEEARVEELAGAEVWALNALHGIRLVTSWSGTTAPEYLASTDRARAWNDRWRNARAHVSDR